MRATTVAVLGTLALLLAGAAPGPAQESEMSNPDTAAYVRNLAFVGDRAVQLAEAIPEEKYGWRPMEGVRSVSEAIMHIAAANYFFGGRIGTPPPDDVDVENLEKVTAKADCIAMLERSNEHLAKALAAVPDVQAATDIFGREGTVEDMVLIAVSHVHEHFGQLIAYARSNQVVPPWSQGGGS